MLEIWNFSKAFLVSQTEDHVKISFVIGSTFAKCKDFSGFTRLLFSTKKGCSFVRRVKFSSFLWLRRDFWTHVERHWFTHSMRQITWNIDCALREAYNITISFVILCGRLWRRQTNSRWKDFSLRLTSKFPSGLAAIGFWFSRWFFRCIPIVIDS